MGLVLGSLAVFIWVLATNQGGIGAAIVLAVLFGWFPGVLIMFALATLEIVGEAIYRARQGLLKGKYERAVREGDLSPMDMLPIGEWGPGTPRREAAERKFGSRAVTTPSRTKRPRKIYDRREPNWWQTQFPGTCAMCEQPYEAGKMVMNDTWGRVVHMDPCALPTSRWRYLVGHCEYCGRRRGLRNQHCERQRAWDYPPSPFDWSPYE